MKKINVNLTNFKTFIMQEYDEAKYDVNSYIAYIDDETLQAFQKVTQEFQQVHDKLQSLDLLQKPQPYTLSRIWNDTIGWFKSLGN